MQVQVVDTASLQADDSILFENRVATLNYAPVWDRCQQAYSVTLWFPEERVHESVNLTASTRKIVGK